MDTGGVCRDMFSEFWDKAYEKAFDGANTLMPAVHPHVQISLFPLGAILSHGFMSCGFIPVRLTFPTIASIVLGTSVTPPDSISSSHFKFSYDRAVVQKALNECSSRAQFADESHFLASFVVDKDQHHKIYVA